MQDGVALAATFVGALQAALLARAAGLLPFDSPTAAALAAPAAAQAAQPTLQLLISGVLCAWTMGLGTLASRGPNQPLWLRLAVLTAAGTTFRSLHMANTGGSSVGMAVAVLHGTLSPSCALTALVAIGAGNLLGCLWLAAVLHMTGAGVAG